MNEDIACCITSESNIDSKRRMDYCMMPQAMATPIEARIEQQPTRGEALPVAEILEVVQDDSEFDTPSASSFVTEENEQFNRGIDYRGHITGHELLARMKEHRKKKTARSAVVGGLLGMLILGPVGALGVGTATAVLTKRRMKKREKDILSHLGGRLDEPLQIVSRKNSCSRRMETVT